MDPDSLRRLIRSLGDTETGGSAPSDAQLLERFVTWRDQAAFELLVWRHGPMVLGVCRRLLPNLADAEDAFQATFLVLVRKAASVIRREAVGGWLYRVAHRVALRARSVLARQAVREQPGVDRLAAPACAVPAWDALRRVLDEEIDRLPSRQRTAFVLCCLEGKTSAEAARAGLSSWYGLIAADACAGPSPPPTGPARPGALRWRTGHRPGRGCLGGPLDDAGRGDAECGPFAGGRQEGRPRAVSSCR